MDNQKKMLEFWFFLVLFLVCIGIGIFSLTKPKETEPPPPMPNPQIFVTPSPNLPPTEHTPNEGEQHENSETPLVPQNIPYWEFD